MITAAVLVRDATGAPAGAPAWTLLFLATAVVVLLARPVKDGIQDALDRVAKNRTTLVIAHRLSTVRRADAIVVLEQGRIVEEGPHDELIAKRGAYYRYYSLSFQQAITGPATAVTST